MILTAIFLLMFLILGYLTPLIVFFLTKLSQTKDNKFKSSWQSVLNIVKDTYAASLTFLKALSSTVGLISLTGLAFILGAYYIHCYLYYFNIHDEVHIAFFEYSLYFLGALFSYNNFYFVWFDALLLFVYGFLIFFNTIIYNIKFLSALVYPLYGLIIIGLFLADMQSSAESKAAVSIKETLKKGKDFSMIFNDDTSRYILIFSQKKIVIVPIYKSVKNIDDVNKNSTREVSLNVNVMYQVYSFLKDKDNNKEYFKLYPDYFEQLKKEYVFDNKL